MVLEISITLCSYLSKIVKDKAWLVFCVFFIVYNKVLKTFLLDTFKTKYMQSDLSGKPWSNVPWNRWCQGRINSRLNPKILWTTVWNPLLRQAMLQYSFTKLEKELSLNGLKLYLSVNLGLHTVIFKNILQNEIQWELLNNNYLPIIQ